MKRYMLVLSFCFAPFMNGMEKFSEDNRKEIVSISPEKPLNPTIIKQLEKALNQTTKQKTRRNLIRVERSTWIGNHYIISSHYYKPLRRCQWRPVQQRVDNSSEAEIACLHASTIADMTQLRDADITKEDVFSAILRENARKK
jgi:hypothetical protein